MKSRPTVSPAAGWLRHFPIFSASRILSRMPSSMAGLAVVLATTVIGSASVRQSSSEASPWLQFHATTETERREADFWDDVTGHRLKPGETTIRGIHKDYGNALRPPGAGPIVYGDFLRRWTCESDYVVVGIPTTSKAILTPHESNIFTEYRVNVKEWLRGSPERGTSVLIPTTFVVSLDGGRIITAEGTLDVKDDPPLQAFAQFVLFLKPIPATSSYRLAGPALAAAKTTVALPDQFYFAPPELLDGSKRTSDVLADIKSAGGTCRGQWDGSGSLRASFRPIRPPAFLSSAVHLAAGPSPTVAENASGHGTPRRIAPQNKLVCPLAVF
jgi:hypothetical protein